MYSTVHPLQTLCAAMVLTLTFIADPRTQQPLPQRMGWHAGDMEIVLPRRKPNLPGVTVATCDLASRGLLSRTENVTGSMDMKLNSLQPSSL